VTLHLKRDKLAHLNLYLISNVADYVIFLFLKVYNSENSYNFFLQHGIAQATFVETLIGKLSVLKVMSMDIIFDQTKLSRVPLWIGHLTMEGHLKLNLQSFEHSLYYLGKCLMLGNKSAGRRNQKRNISKKFIKVTKIIWNQ